MPNVFPTMRVPGFRSSSFCRRRFRLSGSRKSAMTVAFEMSASNMSPWTNIALSATPAFAAFSFEYWTRSGLNSTPSALRAALGRGDDVAAIAGPEVDDEIARRHGRHVEHLLDHLFGVGTQTTSFPG